MCNKHQHFNHRQCIVPPYMAEKIEQAFAARPVSFAGPVKTRFNDELFRKKRTLLTEMSGKQMNAVLSVSLDKVLSVVSTVKAKAKAAPAAKKAAKAAPPAPTPNRLIYDALHTELQSGLPGKLKRKEGQKPVADKDVNNIYDNSGYTWNFYYNQFQRNSVDGKGAPLVHSVHFGNNYENAFWEGTQMVYGDGGEVFKSFTEDIDITGHELTHGVVQHEASLEYIGQSGAINESMADVFGVMVRQLAKSEDTTKGENWLIGRTCMKGSGYVLRSMAAPGTAYKNHPILGNDPQPGHMNDYVNTNQDNRGVHINSGIPNHAFYLAARYIGGQPWLKAGKIWYAALCDSTLLTATSQFADLANAIVSKAEALFGINSPEAAAVKKAWKDVGL